MNTCGIYKIENKINGVKYIGKSVNIEERWRHYKQTTREDQPILLAIKKYGIENFEFSIIEKCSIEELNEKEQYYIKFYDTYNNGYNATYGGDGKILYNYKDIYNKWQEGYLCKELKEIFNCDQEVIHNALISYGVTQEEIIFRGKNTKNIVAIEPINKKPVKTFNSIQAIFKILKRKPTSSIKKAIEKFNIIYGYYWEILNENNKPEVELDDDTFLKESNKRTKICKEDTKKKISNALIKIERPSREELKYMIRNDTFVSIAKKYKVHSCTIPRWCKDYNLPSLKKEIKNFSNEEWELI